MSLFKAKNPGYLVVAPDKHVVTRLANCDRAHAKSVVESLHINLGVTGLKIKRKRDIHG